MCCGADGREAAPGDGCMKQKWSTRSGTCFPKVSKQTSPARQSQGSSACRFSRVTVTIHPGKPPHAALQEPPTVPRRLQVPLRSSLHGLEGSVAVELRQEPRAEL